MVYHGLALPSYRTPSTAAEARGGVVSKQPVVNQQTYKKVVVTYTTNYRMDFGLHGISNVSQVSSSVCSIFEIAVAIPCVHPPRPLDDECSCGAVLSKYGPER